MRTQSTCLVLLIALCSPSVLADWVKTNGPPGGIVCLAFGGTNIFAGGAGGIFFSTNDGASWTQAYTGVPGAALNDLAAKSPDRVFGGCGSGVYRSTDIGEGWVQVNNGLLDTKVVGIGISSQGDLFAGTGPSSQTSLGCRTYRSTNDGETWAAIGPPWFDANVHSIVMDGYGKIFAGAFSYNSPGVGLYRSSDYGLTWVGANKGMSG